MVQILRAKASDLTQIQELLKLYGNWEIGQEHINKHDIAVVAKADDKVVGFVWAGRMARGRKAYLDTFVVHPDHNKRGVGYKLVMRAFLEAKRRGVKDFVSCVRRDKFHDSVAVSALKMGASADSLPYTLISGNLDFMLTQMAEVLNEQKQERG